MQNDLRGFNFDMNLSSIEPWASYSRDHTDLPRLREGRVGAQVQAVGQVRVGNKLAKRRQIHVQADLLMHQHTPFGHT